VKMKRDILILLGKFSETSQTIPHFIVFAPVAVVGVFVAERDYKED